MKIPIELLALILLVLHLGSVVYIGGVLRKQWRLLKVPIYPEIKRFRRVLFTLSAIILIGNAIPIFVDLVTILTNNSLGRTPSVKPISFAYAMSNALTALVSAYLIHTLYKLAASTKEITDYEATQLVNKSDTISADKPNERNK